VLKSPRHHLLIATSLNVSMKDDDDDYVSCYRSKSIVKSSTILLVDMVTLRYYRT